MTSKLKAWERKAFEAFKIGPDFNGEKWERQTWGRNIKKQM